MTGSVVAFATRSWAAFRQVARNPDIRRVEIAWTACAAAKGCLAVALLVFAYEQGGAVGVAALGVVQMLPSAITAPIATGLGGRYRRDRVLTTRYIVATAATAALALALNARAGVGLVFVLAGVAATPGSLVRPIQASLLPALARSPGELIAANIVSSTGDGVGGLVGALLAFGLVGRRRLAPTFALGLAAWGVPILLIGLFPQPVLAVVLLGALGIGNAVLDVSGFTLLQGTVPDAVRAAVLGCSRG